MDLVEQIGSGIIRIRDLCREYEVEEPEFRVSEDWVAEEQQTALPSDRERQSHPRDAEGRQEVAGDRSLVLRAQKRTRR